MRAEESQQTQWGFSGRAVTTINTLPYKPQAFIIQTLLTHRLGGRVQHFCLLVYTKLLHRLRLGKKTKKTKKTHYKIKIKTLKLSTLAANEKKTGQKKGTYLKIQKLQR